MIFCGGSMPETFDYVRLQLVHRLLDMDSKLEPEYIGLYKRLIDDMFDAKEIGGSSDTEIIKLYKEVEMAVCALSATQQNGGMGHKFDTKLQLQYEREIRVSIRKIAKALTGRKIKFL